MSDDQNKSDKRRELQESRDGFGPLLEGYLQNPSPEQGIRVQQQVRLLRILLLTLFMLLTVTLILVLVDIPTDDPLRVRYFFLVGSVMLLMIPSYGLNEAGRYRAASKLTVLLAMVGTWSTLIIDPMILLGDPIPLLYLSLAPMLASLLLNLGETMLVAAVQLIGIPLIPIISPLSTDINWASLWVFVFFISAFSIVFSRVLQQDLERIMEQAQKLSHSEERMRELAVRDPLTGLFNRRHLDDVRRSSLSCGEDDPSPHCLILIDVDDFKTINDQLGHDAGDFALQEVAAVLQEHIRQEDWAFRYGGDEFLVVMPRTPLETARERAGLFLRKVQNIKLPEQKIAKQNLCITAGIARYPAHGTNCERVLLAADHALLRGKEQGGNQVVVANRKDMGGKENRSNKMSQDISDP